MMVRGGGCNTMLLTLLHRVQAVYGGMHSRLIDNTVIRHGRHRLMMMMCGI